jgi:hypothetical protein
MGAQIFEPVTLDFPSKEFLGKEDFQGAIIGEITSEIMEI